MSHPTVVLDTNALADRDLRHLLRSHAGRRILPSVAYAEASVHYAPRLGQEKFRASLAHLGLEIEWFRAEHAERAAQTGLLVGDFAQNARDHIIASHAAAPDRVLVTQDRRDFTFLPRVWTPAEAVRELSRR